VDQNWYPMRWFGESWGSPMNKINPQVEVPVGKACNRCKQAIEAVDSGMVTGKAAAVWHRNCYEEAHAEANKKAAKRKAKT